MHVHHERNESMDAKEASEHGWTDDTHEFKVHFPNEGTCIGCRSQQANNTNLLSDFRPLFFCEGNEGLSCALGVGYQCKFGKSCFEEDARYQSGKIHYAHLTDIPCPHSWIRGVEE